MKNCISFVLSLNSQCLLFRAYKQQCAECFLSNHPNQSSTVSGKSPTESEYGQAEEGAEGRVERLDLS